MLRRFHPGASNLYSLNRMNTDTSFTTKIARLRSRTLAINRRRALEHGLITGFYAKEQGLGGGIVDDSTRAARAIGQIRQTIETGSAQLTAVLPCCSS